MVTVHVPRVPFRSHPHFIQKKIIRKIHIYIVRCVFTDLMRENRQSTGSNASIGGGSLNSSSINSNTTIATTRNQRVDSKDFKTTHTRERNETIESSSSSSTNGNGRKANRNNN